MLALRRRPELERLSTGCRPSQIVVARSTAASGDWRWLALTVVVAARPGRRRRALGAVPAHLRGPAARRATSCGSRARPARRAPTPALRPARPAPHRPGLGVARRCRCAAASSCWRSVPAWSASPATCDWHTHDDPARAWSPPVARCSSASTPGASTAAARCGGRACRSRPATVFAARASCWREFLLVASVFTIVLAVAARRACPTPSRAGRARCARWLVVTVQVVAAALRWSAQRPFAVDLRSARATPAPPLVMVGYSTRLAVSTTLTGLVFSGSRGSPTGSSRCWSPSRSWPGPAWRLVRVAAALARPRAAGRGRGERRGLRR